MIYLDNGATSFHKPPCVEKAMVQALRTCANPGRGGYAPSQQAAKVVYDCRCAAGALFDCQPEQVLFTKNCTEGLNMAIGTLVKPGSRVVISGFEHNAVTRPLYALNAKISIAGRRLFDVENTINEFEIALKNGVDAAIFTHCSNVFGYVLPVEEIAKLCRKYAVPFIVDAAQSAGILPVSLAKWGADFVAMPGHKGLLGPQGTGLLLCSKNVEPLLRGGTGSISASYEMPVFLPDRGEAGTLNAPGIAGLSAALDYLNEVGIDAIREKEMALMTRFYEGVKDIPGITIYGDFSEERTAVVTLNIWDEDSSIISDTLFEDYDISTRPGAHCAPRMHEALGTTEQGAVRFSFSWFNTTEDVDAAIQAVRELS